MATVEVESRKRKYEDEAENAPPNKVFIVDYVPMDIDEPVLFDYNVFNLFPVPRLLRSVNES
jgi:hypothetical protein